MFGAITALTLALVWSARFLPGGVPSLPGLLSIGSLIETPPGPINFNSKRKSRCRSDLKALAEQSDRVRHQADRLRAQAERARAGAERTRERSRHIRIEVERVRDLAREQRSEIRHKIKHKHKHIRRHAASKRKRCRSWFSKRRSPVLTRPTLPSAPIPPVPPVPPIPPVAPLPAPGS